MHTSGVKAGWSVGRVASLGLAIALILGANGISYVSQQDLLESSRAVEHTHQVLYQIERLLSHLKDVGNGLRSYLASGDREYLERSDAAIEALPDATATLQSLLADNPKQNRRLETLRPLIAERLAWLSRLIENGRIRGETALTPGETMFGRTQMDDIRGIVATMIVEETDLGRIRTQAAQNRARLMGLAQVGVTMISLAVIGLLFLPMYWEVRRRRMAESALQDLNITLERRVGERTKQLEDSEHQYRSVVNLIQEAIWIHLDGSIVFANQSAAQLFGAQDPGELIGRSIFSLIHPDDRTQALERTRVTVVHRKALPVIDMRFLGLDGRTRIGAVHALPFIQNGAIHSMASARDVTTLREAEAQLQQAQKMESVGQITGGVAHDFNNLLTVIIGNLDVAVDRVPPDLRPVIESTLRAAERGSGLVGQLLAFSRRQALAPETLDFNRLAEGMEDLLHRTLGEAVEIETKLAPNPWPAMADKGQVESALLNLAINARDAMPNGGKLTIETGNVHLDDDYAERNAEIAPGDYAMLAVTDTGVGMPPEVLERAFEPFFTTKETGRGTGLGLSMIYGFAKQSGGHLKIYSEVGHGTTVRLYLPRASMTVEAATAPKPAQVDHPRGGETILVVEDDADVRAYVVGQLRDLGYNVIEAVDGPRAQTILESESPIDLLFTDVIMPGGMTGRNLAERAKARRPDLRTLFTSGYTENSIIHQGKLDPGVYLLSKPYRRQELARKIREVLDASP